MESEPIRRLIQKWRLEAKQYDDAAEAYYGGVRDYADELEAALSEGELRCDVHKSQTITSFGCPLCAHEALAELTARLILAKLSTAPDGTPADVAVDPHVSSTGTPTTREKV